MDDAENVLLFPPQQPAPDGANGARPPRPNGANWGAGTQALAALVALTRGAVELGKLAMVLAAVMLAGYGLAALLGLTR
jgi:hypothetical protein